MNVSQETGRFLQLLKALLLQLICLLAVTRNSSAICIERERQALLSFKKGLVDPDDFLSSWKSSEKDCCKWRGVTCNNQTAHIIKLDLRPVITYSSDIGISCEPLVGEISSSLLELQYLNHLDLSYNVFPDIPDFIGSLIQLRYLDLSYIGFTRIPKSIGSLAQLEYLNISFNRFNGTLPSQLGNLSRLHYFDLSFNMDLMVVDNFEWISHLSSLLHLKMSQVDFSKAVNWLQSIKLNPSLLSLYFDACQFPEVDSSSFSLGNFSKSLRVIHFSGCTFHPSSLPLLINMSSKTVDLSLSDNQLKGLIPDSFWGLNSLQHVDFSWNQLEWPIPKSLGNLCSLKSLTLSKNNLAGSVHDLLLGLTGCTMNCLEILRLNDNKLTGSLLDIARFPALRVLNLDDNQLEGFSPYTFGHLSQLAVLKLARNKLTGSLPESIGQMSSLKLLDISSNGLDGVISEAHLLNLSQLSQLDLSLNSLSLSFSFNWIPPFQLDYIKMRSCQLGPEFPWWLQRQTKFSHLDISNSNISDIIPSWFWFLPPNLRYLNLSFNSISGKVPNLPLKFNSFPGIDLSSNLFYGSLPPFLSNTTVLNLSKNKFQGSPSFLCTVNDSVLSYLDLSNNLLSGRLPDCWMNLRNLIVLNLEDNDFSGTIPSSMVSLERLRSFRVRNNSFSGELSPSLRNCPKLTVLDLGENNFSGAIPPWIGENLTSLVVLRLRSNEFFGKIPPSLCQLEYLQVLDISVNNVSGAIPSCLNNLTAIARRGSSYISTSYFVYYFDTSFDGNGDSIVKIGADYLDHASIVWKGWEHEYGKTLELLKIIDLSSNKLTGEIPREVTTLQGLITLNLSRNTLAGSIPWEIGKLVVLESLDLSTNHLSGEIPRSLADLYFLSVLDLSKNNLSGKIPSSTQLQSFNAASYIGNPELCGAPLKDCPKDNTVEQPNSGGNEEEEWFERLWFYFGMGAGFIAGFWAVLGTLLLSRSWRFAYFQYLHKIGDWICLTIALKMDKFQRRLRS
ncbi:hypothetical protein SLEP1_g643 [Rubroshorea leprosula]|uniref:Uncharacterized protein n=1 Tax=Rubroshorea leprosula TaxID=152421 RepID=A0AAV5HHX1_9ROSI|nr:hypothetical protein SLEP1_g643 [Rubroshorea leprosula]